MSCTVSGNCKDVTDANGGTGVPKTTIEEWENKKKDFQNNPYNPQDWAIARTMSSKEHLFVVYLVRVGLNNTDKIRKQFGTNSIVGDVSALNGMFETLVNDEILSVDQDKNYALTELGKKALSMLNYSDEFMDQYKAKFENQE